MADRRTYRPAAVVRLQIRLEDYAEKPGKFPSEQSPFESQLSLLLDVEAEAINRRASALGVRDREGAAQQAKVAADARRQIDRLRARSPAAAGTAEQRGDPFSVDLTIVPLEATVDVNTYLSADTCDVKFPFRDAPLESQNIRSALIEVYLGTVAAEDFATPGRWRLPQDKQTILFRGYVDDWETEHGDDDAVVSVRARSLESILIDTKVDPRAPVFRVNASGERISDYVTRVLAALPATSGRRGGDQLKARYFHARSAAEPVLSRASLLRVLQTAKSRNKANPSQDGVLPDAAVADPGAAPGDGDPRVGPGIAQEMSAWDLIVQACYQAGGVVPTYDPSARALEVVADERATLAEAGFIPGVAAFERVREVASAGDFILIRPPQTIYDSVQQGVRIEGGAIDGFRRDLPNPDSPGATVKNSEVRFLVWGRNIKSVRTSRKLGRVKVPTVEVKSYNPDAPAGKRELIARFPPIDAKRATRVGPKGDGKTEEVVRRIVRGIRDLKLLEQVAVSLYHAIGRNELEVQVETDDLSSYIDPTGPDDHNENPDVLRLRHGTPVRVLVARKVVSATSNDVTVTPLSDLFERRTDELRRFLLEQQGRYRPELSADLSERMVDEMVRRMATTINDARRTDVFYVKSVAHSWSADDGWSARITLCNFIEARNLAKQLGTTAVEVDAELRLKVKGKGKPGVQEEAVLRIGKMRIIKGGGR